MARLEGISDAGAGLAMRAVYKAAVRRTGAVPEPLRIMALNPWVMRAALGFELGIARAKTLEPRLKDLASLKVSAMVGCVF